MAPGLLQHVLPRPWMLGPEFFVMGVDPLPPGPRGGLGGCGRTPFSALFREMRSRYFSTPIFTPPLPPRSFGSSRGSSPSGGGGSRCPQPWVGGSRPTLKKKKPGQAAVPAARASSRSPPTCCWSSTSTIPRRQWSYRWTLQAERSHPSLLSEEAFH